MQLWNISLGFPPHALCRFMTTPDPHHTHHTPLPTHACAHTPTSRHATTPFHTLVLNMWYSTQHTQPHPLPPLPVTCPFHVYAFWLYHYGWAFCVLASPPTTTINTPQTAIMGVLRWFLTHPPPHTTTPTYPLADARTHRTPLFTCRWATTGEPLTVGPHLFITAHAAAPTCHCHA